MSDQLTPGIVLWTGVAFVVAGTALAAWGARMLRLRRRREASTVRATGRVVENRVELDMENDRRIHPVVEFTGADGRRHRVECLWSSQLEHPVGAEVPVYYDPMHPEMAGIVGEGRLGPTLLLVLASAMAGFGLLLAVAGGAGFPPLR